MGEGRRLVGEDSRSGRANARARSSRSTIRSPLTDDQEREIDRIAHAAQQRAVDQGPYTMSGE